MINAIIKFKELVAPEKTRIESLFPLILVFGGNSDIKNGKYSSCRNVFLHWSAETKFELDKFFRWPEQFPQWNHFEEKYNLVDFEKDVGCLSSGIVLFSESPGALAELGAFCTDDVLSERLLVVMGQKHYAADSFIKWGPIQRIADANQKEEDAICVVSTTKNPNEFETEVTRVGKALLDKVKLSKKSRKFLSKGTRDRFLLIADLIELFGALTEKELGILLKFMVAEPSNLKRMLKQLILFELIIKEPIGNERYYVPPIKGRAPYLKYTAQANAKFDRLHFKLTAIHPELKERKNEDRLEAYAKYHGVPR